ncbi:protein kinase [bacterium]|nr:protein kinase [bacterium]
MIRPDDPTRDARSDPSSLANSATSSSSQDALPRVIGRYAIEAELGRGGMGAVFRALDPVLKRQVAIKVLLDPAHATADARRRFRSEASAAARLKHPGIVSVHEFGEHEGKPFLVMDLILGVSLEARLTEGSLPAKRVAEIVREVALALEHAHSQNVIHRDVKPGNVLIDRDGRPHLTDFGLARDMLATELTATGAVLGTPAYMAPEQAGGDVREQGPRTDIYALGGLLYRALVGRPPFRAKTMQALLSNILLKDPVPPRTLNRALHADLETITLKCLAKEPARRYARAEDVAEDLRRFLEGEPILARPVGLLERSWLRAKRNPVSALAALVLVVGGTGALALGGRELSVRASRLARASRIIEEVGAGPLLPGAPEYASRQDELVGLKDDRVVDLLVERLDATTAELDAVTRELYLRAKMPDADEARLGGRELPGLEKAVLAMLALEPGAEPDREARSVLQDARRRLEERDERADPNRAVGHFASMSFRAQLWREQSQRVSRKALAVCRFACDALGRLRSREALPALARFLFADLDEARAAAAAEALCLTASEDGARLVLARDERYGGEGSGFHARLARILGDAGVKADWPATTVPDLVRRGTARALKGDLRGALSDMDQAIGLDRMSARAWLGRASVHCKQDAFDLAIADASRAIELDPHDASAHVALGLARSLKGDAGAAIDDFTRAIELDKHRAETWARRGLAKEASGDHEGAILDAGRAIELEPGLVLAWRVRGQARYERKELGPAIADLSQAIALDPRDMGALYFRIMARGKNGDLGGALAEADHALEIDPGEPELLVARASMRRQRGNIDGAIEDMTRAIAARPRSSSHFEMRAGLRTVKGEARGAIEDWNRAVELAPRSCSALLGRARTRIVSMDPGGGEKDASLVLEIQPDDVDALVIRATARCLLEDHKGELEDRKRALLLRPSAEALIAEAKARMETGDARGALEDASRVILMGERLADAYALRAEVQFRLGDYDAASGDATRALKQDAAHAGALLTRATARRKKGNTKGAIADCTKVIELDNGRRDIGYRMRALFREEQGDLEGASADLKAALVVTPRDASLWAKRARLEERCGRADSAISDYGRSIECEPANADAIFGRGMLLLKKGDAARARADFQRFLEVAPGDPRAAEARLQLER